jgi:SNF2 family DNA or RNA helicase
MLPLPPMRQEDVWLDLSENEKKNYSNLETWAQAVYDELVSTHTLNQKYQKILLVLVRLRQACDHLLLQEGYAYTSKMLEMIKKKHGVEDLFIKKKDEVESEEDEYSFIDYDDSFEQKKTCKKQRKRPRKEEDITEEANKCEEIIVKMDSIVDEVKLNSSIENFECSTKLNYIREFIKRLFQNEPDAKVVIFTQFTTMLDLIELVLIQASIKTLRFDSRVQKGCLRKRIIELFSSDPEYKVILTSLKAGGVGLNLVSANYLLLVDPWWNSSVELQAFDRVHRIGQKKPVVVYRLLINGSIEEEVLKIQEKKNNQGNSFYDMFSEKVLSIKDIHTVFNTIRVRQLKNNKQN